MAWRPWSPLAGLFSLAGGFSLRLASGWPCSTGIQSRLFSFSQKENQKKHPPPGDRGPSALCWAAKAAFYHQLSLVVVAPSGALYKPLRGLWADFYSRLQQQVVITLCKRGCREGEGPVRAGSPSGYTAELDLWPRGPTRAPMPHEGWVCVNTPRVNDGKAISITGYPGSLTPFRGGKSPI